MAWRLVKSLEVLNTQVRQAAPRAVPPATPASAWGTIGDLAHQSGTSDHNPATYAALGSTPVVCARDFPHAPALGLDGGAFTEALRQSRDKRIAYVIFNGRIFSSTNTPWTWRTYTGSDKHRDHWHVSVVHTAAADSTAPWQMPDAATGEEDMDFNQDAKLTALFDAKDTVSLDTDGTVDGKGARAAFPVPLVALIRSNHEAVMAAVSGRPVEGEVLEAIPAELSDADVDRIATRLAEKLGALRFEAT